MDALDLPFTSRVHSRSVEQVIYRHNKMQGLQGEPMESLPRGEPPFPDPVPLPTRPPLNQPTVLRSFLKSDLSLIGATAVLALTCFFFVERVSVNDGFGWDGVQYGQWVRNFRQEVLVDKTT